MKKSSFLWYESIIKNFELLTSSNIDITVKIIFQFKKDVKNESLSLIAGYSAPGWEKNSTEVFDRIQQDVSLFFVMYIMYI